MSIAERLRVTVSGVEGPPLLFLHGYGCGQEMWRFVAPKFESDHRVVLLDLAGASGADPAFYDPARHVSLEAYRDDVLAVLAELDLTGVTVVGHSVSSMIGVLAHIAAPAAVTGLVLVSPSARYVDDGDYVGGFAQADIDDLVEMISRNHLGWQAPLASLVAGQGHAEAQAELENGFCRTRPDVAAQFADVTFRGDNRADLARVEAPTLVLQVRDDLVAPMSAGRFVHEQVRGSVFRVLETRGHAPQLTVPDEVAQLIGEFLNDDVVA